MPECCSSVPLLFVGCLVYQLLNTALSLVQFVKHCIDHVHLVSICVISNKIMKYSGHLYQVRNTELEALVLSWANPACSFLLPHVKIVIF